MSSITDDGLSEGRPSGSYAEDWSKRVRSRESVMDPMEASVLGDCPFQHCDRLVGPDGENIR